MRVPEISFGVLLFAILSGCGGSGDSPPTPKPSPPPIEASDKVPYQIVDQWRIPNGGYGRVLVVDPKYRNEAELVRLAKQLQSETAQDRNAFVFIFDDRTAASNRKAAIEDRLGKNELAQYDSHTIGSYMRNANTGYHALSIMLQGVNGPSKKIRLP